MSGSAAVPEAGKQPFRNVDLHRHPARRDYFAAPRQGIRFDPTVQCWVVDDAGLIRDLLLDQRFAAIEYADKIASWIARGGPSLPNTIFAANHLPIGLNGAAHDEKRRAFARRLAERRERLVGRLPSFVRECLTPLSRPGIVDLMADVLVPLLRDIRRCYIDMTPAEAPIERLSSIFDRMRGMKSIERVEEAIAETRAAVRAVIGPDAPEDEEGLILSFLLFSRDSLLGTIGESLLHIFCSEPGRRTGAIVFPSIPPETSVPFVERELLEPMTIRSHDLPRGAQVRFMLQSLAYSNDPADHAAIFSLGAHACLGKRLSLEVWGALTVELARLDVPIEVIDYAPRTTDYVFTIPERLIVRVTE